MLLTELGYSQKYLFLGEYYYYSAGVNKKFLVFRGTGNLYIYTFRGISCVPRHADWRNNCNTVQQLVLNSIYREENYIIRGISLFYTFPRNITRKTLDSTWNDSRYKNLINKNCLVGINFMNNVLLNIFHV